MEKENFNVSKVIIISLLFTMIISILFAFTLFGTSYPCESSKLPSLEEQAQNGPFEAYLGTHVSAIEVKQLLSLIKANNASLTDDYGNMKKIYVNSLDSTDDNTVDGGIKKGNYYIVESYNDRSANQEYSISDNDSGYYSNGYLRNIRIELLSSDGSNYTLQMNSIIANTIY